MAARVIRGEIPPDRTIVQVNRLREEINLI